MNTLETINEQAFGGRKRLKAHAPKPKLDGDKVTELAAVGVKAMGQAEALGKENVALRAEVSKLASELASSKATIAKLAAKLTAAKAEAEKQEHPRDRAMASRLLNGLFSEFGETTLVAR